MFNEALFLRCNWLKFDLIPVKRQQFLTWTGKKHFHQDGDNIVVHMFLVHYTLEMLD